MKLGILDKLNFSHLVGKGRWVDFVSNKAFDASLIAMDFGNYIVRELTVAGVKFGAGLFGWVKSKIIGG